jgi:hypothetical protein
MLANRFVLATVALFGLASVSSADQVRGVVVKVDSEAGQITIEARGAGVRGATFTFTLGKDAKILLGQQAVPLKDVPVGKRAQITFETKDGKRVAVFVHVNNLLGNLNNLMPNDAGDRAGANAPNNDPNALTGKLRRVAYTDREIVLAIPGAGDKESYVSLPVAKDAKITRDDQAIKFDDLKEEESAVVRTEMRDGKRVATAVMVGKVTMEKPEDSKITRLRQILKIVDAILEQAEKK